MQPALDAVLSAEPFRGLPAPFLDSTPISIPGDIDEPDGSAPVGWRCIPSALSVSRRVWT
jgi:hypothetical protein